MKLKERQGLDLYGLVAHAGEFGFYSICSGKKGGQIQYIIGVDFVDSDCSHEIKRHVLLGRKAMSNLDSILKSRDITLPTKIHIVKAKVFPVVMYRCES